jgi:hypothetical protein
MFLNHLDGIIIIFFIWRQASSSFGLETFGIESRRYTTGEEVLRKLYFAKQLFLPLFQFCDPFQLLDQAFPDFLAFDLSEKLKQSGLL